MDPLARQAVTWEQVLDLARTLQGAAERDDVAPSEGAKLVRLVLKFNDEVVGSGVRKTNPTTPPAKTG